MSKALVILMLSSIMTACAGTSTQVPSTPFPTEVSSASLFTPTAATAEPVMTPSLEVSPAPAEGGDVFSQMNINLPGPVCNSITPPQMEGPYYKAGTPERNSLLEEGVEGRRLLLVGYVLDQNCNPLPNAWLDFWQADTNGDYDNQGYRLRGHQYTDSQGRYFLETVLPGLYQSRPIEHIHVKVRPEGGQEITSQLYFPNQPVEGLTVTLEEQGDLMIGYFNFVLQR